MKNYVIIVTGQVATGKTRLAKYLSRELAIPLISKDNIKVLLFDSLGTGNREWSKKLGNACYKIMYHCLELITSSGSNLILESNFNSKIASKEISALKKQYRFKIIQIFLDAQPKTLFERFKERIKTRERHPGHVDHEFYEEFKKQSLINRFKPLVINGKLIKIHTNDFRSVDYKKILDEVNKLIK